MHSHSFDRAKWALTGIPKAPPSIEGIHNTATRLTHALALAHSHPFDWANGPYWQSKGTPLNRMGVTTRRHETTRSHYGGVCCSAGKQMYYDFRAMGICAIDVAR